MKISPQDDFSSRHIGPDIEEEKEMLKAVGAEDMNQLIRETIPAQILIDHELDIPEAISEYEYLSDIRKIAEENQLYRSFIGQGYYGTITPPVILRNIFQNPGWYTQYTPYQAEISQGRLEALLNFQTMVSDLTQLPFANASLLDEGTAAAEAMAMFYQVRNKKNRKDPVRKFFVDRQVYHQTIDVLKSRALPLGIEIIVSDWVDFAFDQEYFGALLQYPDSEGNVYDYKEFAYKCKENEIFLTVAADLLSLVLLNPPGEWGADAAVGNTQRFGVPMGFGGPHAGYFATEEKYKRQIPGRIIGVSIDRDGDPALRMALQTREQHIKREKATSNICTAQALLAIMAGMYCAYHGKSGLQRIASRIHELTSILNIKLQQIGINSKNHYFFDTLSFDLEEEEIERIRAKAISCGINFFYRESGISISLDETTMVEEVEAIVHIFQSIGNELNVIEGNKHQSQVQNRLNLKRASSFLDHPVFNRYHTETSMMRYLKSLENKDLSLMHSMIPLGSCTMKLNAVSELLPVSFPEFSDVHPFAPADQVKGYFRIFEDLEKWLCEITGFSACSLQPNSGAQGELTGLLTIRAYHHLRGENQRNIALIPSSAHGTNPASAVMAGMKVVVVNCDDHGNIDYPDLIEKAESYKDNLSALLVTYPSTHGVFEEHIVEVCKLIHDNGGLVYMDGANMNAQVGLTNPASIGADVCHLNLHKTFAIPHGGGGPGVGPICVNDKLKNFLPGHKYAETGGKDGIPAVASAPWGSASILLISYAYIRMLGKRGLKKVSEMAILNANYIKSRLTNHFEVLYLGSKNRVAHELIVDLRMYKQVGISAEDIAKRLIDYGFHAPTLSFPVAGTLMIEPTESENKYELDLFCEAMLQIKKEIDEVASGLFPAEDNVLVNAPHTLKTATMDEWTHSYTREKAIYPLPYLKGTHKFWASVGRVDNAFGDRHLICTCPPIESYETNVS